MPTKQITVCAYCGKVFCDGGMWVYANVKENGVDKGLTGCSKDSIGPKCSLTFGIKQYKHLKGKAVGDEVVLHYTNWVDRKGRPVDTYLTVRKVED